MVFRFVGLIGLILLPGLACADGVGVHKALGKWLSDNGTGTVSYGLQEGYGGLPDDWPHWLLQPGGSEALNRFFLGRGLFPESIGLDWEQGAGAVEVFGVRQGKKGLRLLVDRGMQRPVLLRTPNAVRWRFEDYAAEGNRRSALPRRIVRIDPEGERTVFVPR